MLEGFLLKDMDCNTLTLVGLIYPCNKLLYTKQQPLLLLLAHSNLITLPALELGVQQQQQQWRFSHI